jgi:lipid-binding SYLF domain-containing protein
MQNLVGISMFVLFLCALVVPTMFIADSAGAAAKKEVDASVDVALERFVKNVKGAEEFLKASKGVLVMPRVMQAGFIVGGKVQ